MIIECAQCGKEKKIRPAKAKARNFCSHACYWLDKDTRKTVPCLQCGKEIKRKVGVVDKQKDHQFCGRECFFEYKSGPNHPLWKEVAPRGCDTCGKELTHSSATRARVQHCSLSCSKKGEKAPSWDGGISPYTTDFEKRIRHVIRARDEQKCTTCGTRRYGSNNLHVHHIDCDKKNNHPDNLITLCAKCHKREHAMISMNLGKRSKERRVSPRP